MVARPRPTTPASPRSGRYGPSRAPYDGPAGVMQDAMPPFTFTCLSCGETWLPRPVHGKITEHRLNTEAWRHSCP